MQPKRGERDVRPASITYFERLILLSVALGVVQMAISWPETSRMASPGFTAFVSLVTFAVVIGLALLVSRARSKVAMWIWIIFLVLGTIPFVLLMAKGMVHGAAVIMVIQALAQYAATALLFTPSARAWMDFKSDRTRRIEPQLPQS